jgi:uncharacterized repeat protein (TIGR01451 family)
MTRQSNTILRRSREWLWHPLSLEAAQVVRRLLIAMVCLIVTVAATFMGASPAIAACTAGACISAGPRLASVDTTQSALLGPLLGGLLGTNINLTAADWNTVAQGDVNLLGTLNALQAATSVSTPAQALTTGVTLGQVAAALQTQARAQANTSLAGALSTLQGQLAGAGATVRLGDLLQVGMDTGTLASTTVNSLDLLTGLVQLYNRRNVLSTPAPVGISGAALGLSGVVNAVQLYAQVIEPPVYVGGPAGSSFHEAGVRLKLKLDLVSLTPSVSLLTAIPLVSSAAVSIGKLDLYVEAARADGSLATVDAAARAVTLQAAPGVAAAYIGAIDDAVFFNRTRALAANDVGAGTIGSLTLNGSVVAIQAKGAAQGAAPLSTSVTFSGAFPQTRTVSTGAAFAGNLATSLLSNLTISITPSLGVLDTAVLPVLKTVVVGAINPVVPQLLGSVANPLLRLLGVGLGEMVVTVNGICQACDDFKLTKSVDQASALPGTTITYTIAYQNTGTTTLNTLKISDATPPFTAYAASACGPLPSGLTACSIAGQPAVGANGAVTWNFTGSLAPGATGQVTISVTVQ